MEPYTIARVILLPEGDIHIAYHTRQTYYCTTRALLLLLSDPFCFIDKGGEFLHTSSYLLNRKQEPVDEIQGLTLLTVYSDKRIVCDFTELFRLLYSPYILSSSEVDQNMNITWEQLQSFSHDEKQALIHLFMTYTRSEIVSGHKRKRNLDISAETQSKIMSEIINTSTKSFISRQDMPSLVLPSIEWLESKVKSSECDLTTHNVDICETETTTSETPRELVTLQEFARICDVKVATVRYWKRKNKIKSAVQNEFGVWMVDPNEEIVDGRAGRKSKTIEDGSGRKCIRLKGKDYQSVQLYIQERHLVTDAVRPFIRTYEEAKYYELNNYHEVKWETGSAMIIDIDPNYYCKALGKTNRQIIASGGSPVVPNADQFKFHLHHIGQKKDSPLAIIPEYDHNDEKLYSAFHIGKASKENLHDNEFEKQKRKFWNTYIYHYDQCVFFKKIPFLNSRHKRKEQYGEEK